MNLERSLPAEEKELLQAGVAHAYRDFVGRVASARHKTPAEIEQIAEGRVWIAPDAARFGLVDHLGDLDAAVLAAAKRAKLAPGKYEVTFREKELTWRERLVRELRADGAVAMRGLGFAPAPPVAVARAFGAFQRQLGTIAAFNDPRHLYSYCACSVD
jgi:protease-4